MQSRDNLPADNIVFLVSKVTLFVATDALLALKDSLAANDAIYSPAGMWGCLSALYCYQRLSLCCHGLARWGQGLSLIALTVLLVPGIVLPSKISFGTRDIECKDNFAILFY